MQLLNTETYQESQNNFPDVIFLHNLDHAQILVLDILDDLSRLHVSLSPIIISAIFCVFFDKPDKWPKKFKNFNVFVLICDDEIAWYTVWK